MIIKNATIVNHNNIIENGYIKIENQYITEIGKNYQGEGLDVSNAYILPGFIDIHVHGTNGFDVMDGTTESLKQISLNLVYEGITGYLPTTTTASDYKIKDALYNIYDYDSTNKGAKILGIHLEGPFINPKQAGAQNKSEIKTPDITKMKLYNEISGNRIKIVTYAPELTDENFTKYLIQNRIIASAGHSNASMETIKSHMKAGLTNITHLHNAQSGHHHRNPGIVTAGYLYDNLNVELIVDGIHVKPEIINITSQIKNPDHILLITDALSVKNLENGTYKNKDQILIKKDKIVTLKSGILAGSVLHFDEALRNMKNISNYSMQDLVKISSYNQAKLLKIDERVGVIKEKYYADLVILDKQLNIVSTVCRGTIYHNK
ncbi:N-acetylglucosamine-6-phosphate deacetylase [Candidatus Izemoplasma sp. B36]|uniref:N-acetylglucosamine-6-phosphate deacetylase n=1 Tax=Candidatus Izemoplasma sp. B36 TaxID=3242468 RepID=UPI0035587131